MKLGSIAVSGDTLLVSQPALIKLYGRSGATFVQQIHYWITKGCGVKKDEKTWIYNTFDEWAKQICASSRTVKRIVQKLVSEDIIFVRKLSKNKSDRTNSYTINYRKLEQITQCAQQPTQHQKLHSAKMSQSLGQNDPLVNQRIPNKDILHKSDVVEDNSQDIIEEKEKTYPDTQESPQAKQRSQPHTTQKMLSIWNHEISSLKGKDPDKLNKATARYLMAVYKKKFDSNLEAWKRYCRLIASSPYLMGKDFTLSLLWTLKYTTVDRIFAGELGVNLRCSDAVKANAKSEDILHADALYHIDDVSESDACKRVRHMILKAVGPAQYNAWFTQVDILHDGQTLKAHNKFVEDVIHARFGEFLNGEGPSLVVL